MKLKIMLITLLIITLVTTSFCVMADEASAVSTYNNNYSTINFIVYGDANGDGKVSVLDVISILKHDSGNIYLSEDIKSADINEDDETDFVDAILILRYVKGYISTLNPSRNRYNVSFDLNYDGATNAPDTQSVVINDIATEPTPPSREYFEFTGWYTDKDAINKFEFNTPINKDISLYAGWKDLKKEEIIQLLSSLRDIYDTSTEYIKYPNSSAPHNLDDVYGMYDNLVAKYPDYVTKSLVGTVYVDDNALPIYRYDFTPSSTDSADICKILITNCTHGHEKWTVPVAYRLMLDICSNWEASDVLSTFKNDCHFTIIPIVNPYGFINGTRKNENGIDINRNFEPDFKIIPDNDDGTKKDNYGGTTPKSEQSTQIMTQLAESEHFDFMFDLHNYGSYTGGYKSGYVVPCKKRPLDIGFGRQYSQWASDKTVEFNPLVAELNYKHFFATEMHSYSGYLSSVFPHGMALELLYGWGKNLGTNESAQKLAVELLAGAVLTGMIVYK